MFKFNNEFNWFVVKRSARMPRFSFKSLLSRFLVCSSGNITIILALSLIVVSMCAGVAVDYARIMLEKTIFDQYADDVALMAVNQLGGAISAQDEQTFAVNAFTNMAKAQGWVTINTVNASVVDSGGQRTVIVTYQASMSSTFTAVGGFKNLQFTGSSTAKSAAPQYSDFYVVVDNTPSMGLAATVSDMQKLASVAPDSCSFACHEMDNPSNDNYTLARNNGITLRIDSVQNAVSSLLKTAIGTQNTINNFRFAIYSFGSSAQNSGATAIQPLTTDLSAARNSASNIGLMTIPYQNYRGDTITNFTPIFQSLNSIVGTSGDATSWTKSKKYVFFLSDGVNDSASLVCSQALATSYDPQTGIAYSRCQSPIDSTLCSTLKNNGVTVVALYTTYVPVTTSSAVGWYNAFVGTYNQGPYSPSPNSLIASGMRGCASANFYAEIGPNDSISTVLNNIFQSIVNTPRITN